MKHCSGIVMGGWSKAPLAVHHLTCAGNFEISIPGVGKRSILLCDLKITVTRDGQIQENFGC
jgi:hypothetical protein